MLKLRAIISFLVISANLYLYFQVKAVLKRTSIDDASSQMNRRDVSAFFTPDVTSDQFGISNGTYKKVAPPGIKNIQAANGIENVRLHSVTYASHSGKDDRFCRAIESSIRNGYDLIILGWGSTWHGLSQKLEAAHAYAAGLPPNDVMLFSDAYDVLYVDSPAGIVAQLDAMNATILFSAECGCWPHILEDNGRVCFENYPSSSSPYRYLNSGAWVGRAFNVKNMLFEIIEKAGNNFMNANDQKLVANMFLNGRHNITLDYQTKVFQSMHMTLTPPLPVCDPKGDVIFDDKGKLTNKRTHGRPSIVHFNGGGKKYHLKIESEMWYKKEIHNSPEERKLIGDHLLSAPCFEDGERQIKFKDFCPTYFP